MKKIDQSIFKAYDIRGIYPEQLNEDVAYKIAQAYTRFMGFSGGETVVLGRDVRLSGPKLSEAVRQGLMDHGVNIVDVGVVSTDFLYFATVHGKYDGGLQVSGSHNPREYNGIKMVRKKAVPISGDTGIMDIKDLVVSGYSFKAPKKGKESKQDFYEAYLEKVISVVDASAIKPKKIVANINFGSIGKIIKDIGDRFSLDITFLNENPDGNFPKGRPDPLVPENRRESMELVKKVKPDFGVMWDADADRVFFIDETGRVLSGYFTTAVLANYYLRKYPKSKVVIDMKQNWAIKDVVKEAGGTALFNRTGHSLFKEKMIKEDAVFGGEVSGHYFFKDFFYLDNGIIPFLIILELLSETGKKLSKIYQPFFDKYFAIEETNTKVKNVSIVLKRLKEKYLDGKLSEIDGVSIDYPDWRFNVRPSNTEPLLRLNLEAKSKVLMNKKSEEVLKVIRS